MDIRKYTPKVAPLMTEWSDKVDPDNPHPEYPRPQLVRKEWQSLNGVWDLDIEGHSTQQILVPFCVESALSGVMMRLSKEDDTLVYRRQFVVNRRWADMRILVNFEAVDHEAAVFINGQLVGMHSGGYDPFSFDITKQLKMNEELESIEVHVKDPANTKDIPIGKQWGFGKRDSTYIFYTPCSGIWQSVWIEPVPTEYIKLLRLTPLLDEKSVKVLIETNTKNKTKALVTVFCDHKEVTQQTVEVDNEIDIILGEELKTWSPSDPILYDVKIELLTGDIISSYFGMRKIEIQNVEGFQHIFLNNEILPFQAGPLDQGFWPDGIYTPPTEEAMVWDLKQTKALGYNVIRKHIKIESSRWYFWTDKLGILVWQDFPCISDKIEVTEDGKQNFEKEYRSWLQKLHNHPSIILWVVFNEGWGQFDTVSVTNTVMKLDATRLVTCASGWNDFPVGNIADLHVYPGPVKDSAGNSHYAPEDPKRAAVIGEMWGQSKIPWGHCWFGDKNAEDDPRGGFKTEEEFLAAYSKAVEELSDLQKSRGYNAVVMTQTTDVEGELNGFFSYDRKVSKVEIAKLAEINKKLFA